MIIIIKIVLYGKFRLDSKIDLKLLNEKFIQTLYELCILSIQNHMK
jgi:hypothetical protein